MSSCQDEKAKKTKKQPPLPPLRGLHMAQTMRNIGVAIGLSATCVTLFWFFHNRKRRQRYADFYANYDAEAAADRMMKAGIFQGIPAGGSEPPEDDKKNKK